MTSKSRSVFARTAKVFSILKAPNLPISSMPAVSIRTTGPIGSISIDLYTGSVVVPGVSDTMAIF